MPTERFELAVGVVNGVIYAVGGRNTRGLSNVLEAYDPVTDTWTKKRSMPETMEWPSACASGGRLYVFRGVNVRNSAPVQVYDPGTDTWSQITDVRGGDRIRQCVGSADGRLFVAGDTDLLEFDPAKKTWSRSESPASSLVNSGAAVLDGRFYIVGPEVKSIEIGGVDWITLTPMGEPISSPAITAAGSRLYALGGHNNFRELRVVLEFDPQSNAWTPKSPMNYSIRGHAVVSVGGTLYVIGGSIGGQAVPFVEAYTPALDDGTKDVASKPEKKMWAGANRWLPTTGLLVPRSALSVVGRCDLLMAAVGGDSGGKPVANAEVYYSVHDKWSQLEPMPTPRRFAGAACIGGVLYVAGGEGVKGDVDAVEALDLSMGKEGPWIKKAPLHAPRSKFGLAAMGGKLYAVGGMRGGRVSSDFEVYDPATDVWTKKAALPVAAATWNSVVADGQTIVVFVETEDNPCSKQIFTYDVPANAWRSRGNLKGTPCRSIVAAMGNGSYVFIGGADNRKFSARSVEQLVSGQWDDMGPLSAVRRDAGVAYSTMKGIFVVGGRDVSGDSAAVEEPMPIFPVKFDYWVRPPDKTRFDAVADLQTPPARPMDYAIVIGVDDYRSLPRARGSEGDALSMASYLQKGLGLANENIIVLTKDRASRADLAGYLDEWLPKNLSPESRLYFYFAGHGTVDPLDRKEYLLPWDSDLSFLQSSAYPLAQIFQRLRDTKAREVIAIFDCCFGQDADRCRAIRGIRPLVSRRDQIVADPKITVLFATSGNELAGVNDGDGRGVFTEALIQGLADPANRQRGAGLTVDEWFKPASTKVSNGARALSRTQSPRLYTSSHNMRIY